METWHKSDDFWETIAPFLFSERHWEAAATEIDRTAALLGVELGAAILDMCCGPGRHSLELARRGYRVTGVDRTTAYLEQARQKAEEEGLTIEFVENDMRHFCRPEAFEGAMIMYTSFGYFEDPAENRQVLANIYRSLKGRGALIVDVMGKEVLARVFRERDWDEVDDAIILHQRKVSKDWSWIENRWIAFDLPVYPLTPRTKGESIQAHIKTLPGDDIGPEVIVVGVDVLRTVWSGHS